MRQDDFIPLTNFTFRFICKVTSSCVDNADHNGFIVEVKTQGADGEEEKGYDGIAMINFALHRVIKNSLHADGSTLTVLFAYIAALAWII